MELLQRCWKRTLALCLLLGAVLALPVASRAAVGVGSFSVEQVYVNVPELDVFLYALDGNGDPISPAMARAAGVELRLGDTPLDIGNIQAAREPVCYLFALNPTDRADPQVLRGFRRAITALAQRKGPRDQIGLYLVGGSTGAERVLPATSDVQSILSAVAKLSPREQDGFDLVQAAATIYADINDHFQDLAPRKVLLGCSDALSLLEDVGLLGGLLSGATDQLNLELRAIAASEQPEDLALLTQLSGGRIVPCSHDGIEEAVLAQADSLQNALEIKTAISDALYGERLETLTLSAPALGSAVSATATVYMGHRLTRPAVQAVQATGRGELTVTFNQAVSAATASSSRSYRVQSEDAWGFRVKVRSVAVQPDGRTAILYTDPLYEGSYSVSLYNVAAQLSAANLSDSGAAYGFSITQWPRDRGFYLARLRVPALALAALLLVLAVRAFGRSRRERAAEHAAEVEHLLEQPRPDMALPRRWVTLFIRAPDAIAETRWSALVECSLLIGSDPAVCELCVPDPAVAPQHCLLALEDGQVVLLPLGEPPARVYVDRQRVAAAHHLRNDDVIRIGRTDIRVVL